jgi:16S rRNA U516 pseudouridylate synthase RsuA-like enzyme
MEKETPLSEVMQKLLNGIRVRKYHYTEMKSEVVIVKLSEDFRIFSWTYLDSKYKGIKQFFKRKEFEISEIQRIVFGPVSYTF